MTLILKIVLPVTFQFSKTWNCIFCQFRMACYTKKNQLRDGKLKWCVVVNDTLWLWLLQPFRWGMWTKFSLKILSETLMYAVTPLCWYTKAISYVCKTDNFKLRKMTSVRLTQGTTVQLVSSLILNHLDHCGSVLDDLLSEERLLHFCKIPNKIEDLLCENWKKTTSLFSCLNFTGYLSE